MRITDLVNGAKAAARSEPAAVTSAEEAKCYVWDARGNGAGGVSPTLTGDHENRVTDYTAICVSEDQQPVIHTEKTQRKYIVRRLTPLECCRLQGFPDGWGDTVKKDDMTDEEYRFWLKVRQDKEKAGGKQPKEYTPSQILLWYNKLHTDSAEYKMWGNGIALPCAVFVLGGIINTMRQED